MPTSEAFRIELRSQLRQAALRGVLYVDINSGDLHRKLGGYPGPYHVMPSCCKIMYDEQWDGDQIRSSPQKGFGASLTIRYKLPRWKD